MHVGRVNIVEDPSEENKSRKPNTKLSQRRADNLKSNRVAKQAQSFKKMTKIKVVDNNNIIGKHLERQGLHLNALGNKFLARNLLSINRSWRGNNDLAFNNYGFNKIVGVPKIVNNAYNVLDR